jgi:hypothetical protein
MATGIAGTAVTTASGATIDPTAPAAVGMPTEDATTPATAVTVAATVAATAGAITTDPSGSRSVA